MLIVVSPAKSLDFETKAPSKKFTEPDYLQESTQLVGQLQKLSPDDFSELMHISSSLGELNHQRFANWHTPFDLDNAKQAIFAFKGDVYIGLEAEQFSTADLNFAQNHLRILSGLYGLLRPLDLMQPYRLEMGSRFQNKKGKNLYEFWGNRLTDNLNEIFEQDKKPVLVNLASKEYFNAIKPSSLNAEIISPVFKDFSNGKYKIVSFFAKKARGYMAAYIIKNRIKDPKKLREFDVEGYRYSEDESTASEPVFLRDAQ
ncbi:MAG: peroxide stress protein YaaA [Gammaproteobacteria bacterium]|nr:peroxide stress protein YaaA [Gammaproteobacteria bacterium]MDG2336906.1 peroxide stress protein YaaA [Gammaproteobacteria bacterium]